MQGPKGTGCARPRTTRFHLRVLKILEIGAGGKRLGSHAGEFTRRLGSDSGLRRILLGYANRRRIRGGGEPFRAVAVVASDIEPNPANDLRLDVHSLPICAGTIHIVVAVGPSGYGFRRPWTARRFLSEVSRVLVRGGELIVVGRFMNPWFNPELGSKRGRRYVRAAARQGGLGVANLLTPLGERPVASIFRIPGDRFIQRTSNGKKLGAPSYFHRFVKLARGTQHEFRREGAAARCTQLGGSSAGHVRRTS